MKVHHLKDNRIIALRESTDLDNNRIRFNWGYHDGANDYLKKWDRVDGLTYSTIAVYHFDSVYAQGYMYGQYDAEHGNYYQNSNLVWQLALLNRHVTDGITDYSVKNLKRILLGELPLTNRRLAQVC